MKFIEKNGYILMDKRIFIELLPFDRLSSPRQLEIIKLKFFGDYKTTYVWIGEQLGITSVRARYVIQEALSKYRRYYGPKRRQLNLTKKQLLHLLGDSIKLYNEVFGE